MNVVGPIDFVFDTRTKKKSSLQCLEQEELIATKQNKPPKNTKSLSLSHVFFFFFSINPK